MSTIVWHLGAHNTATTYIQKVLRRTATLFDAGDVAWLRNERWMNLKASYAGTGRLSMEPDARPLVSLSLMFDGCSPRSDV